MCAMTLLIPIFIIKIPWYLIVFICWIDNKAREIYLDLEDEVLNIKKK